MEQIGDERVRITGIKGLPPPPTTKVGITAPAGFQCEWHFFMCGLDIEEKCKITEDQIRDGNSAHSFLFFFSKDSFDANQSFCFE